MCVHATHLRRSLFFFTISMSCFPQKKHLPFSVICVPLATLLVGKLCDLLRFLGFSTFSGNTGEGRGTWLTFKIDVLLHSNACLFSKGNCVPFFDMWDNMQDSRLILASRSCTSRSIGAEHAHGDPRPLQLKSLKSLKNAVRQGGGREQKMAIS